MDVDDTNVAAYEPVFINGEVKGFCTSDGDAYNAETSIAFALIARVYASDILVTEIEMIGLRRKARRITKPLFDPDESAMRR